MTINIVLSTLKNVITILGHISSPNSDTTKHLPPMHFPSTLAEDRALPESTSVTQNPRPCSIRGHASSRNHRTPETIPAPRTAEVTRLSTPHTPRGTHMDQRMLWSSEPQATQQKTCWKPREKTETKRKFPSIQHSN